jgi:GT2 family glycosyltransferase
VLTYNRFEELCRTLERLLALPQRYPVIVVDNGGTDGTAARLKHRFPGVLLVRAPRNLGAAGRNLGVAHVVTPYVAFCDDDTWWEPEALVTAVEILESKPELAVLSARVLVGPEKQPDATCSVMAESPLPHIEGVGPQLIGFMAGASIMRTQSFLDAGGYWAPFFIGGEEALLAMDILDAGGIIAYAPALEVSHWPSSFRDATLRRRTTARNELWTAWMRLPWLMAARRTVHLLKTLPSLSVRIGVVCAAAYGWRQVREHRRRLKPATCLLFEKVWRHTDGVVRK